MKLGIPIDLTTHRHPTGRKRRNLLQVLEVFGIQGSFWVKYQWNTGYFLLGGEGEIKEIC